MKKNNLMLVMLVILLGFLGGCLKPFNTPEYKTIGASQTAFLIPLDGDTKGNQASFDSYEFLESAKVPVKRIRIAKRWNQTGRNIFFIFPKGKWIPTESLLIVERKPITREWTANPTSGTSNKNEGIETESKGSIGFVVGIGITAQIDEPNATKFLYRYNSKPLHSILDEEIRNRIESKFNEECSKLTLKQIMISKAQILKSVKEDVKPYFAERGITITNIGYKGQFSYSDPKIQESINKEFIAEKERLAQEKVNEMNVERAKKEAEAKRIAQVEMNKLEIAKAEAEAKAIKIRSTTLNSQIKLKELEIREHWIQKWNGQLPTHSLGKDNSMMMNIK